LICEKDSLEAQERIISVGFLAFAFRIPGTARASSSKNTTAEVSSVLPLGHSCIDELGISKYHYQFLVRVETHSDKKAYCRKNDGGWNPAEFLLVFSQWRGR